MFSAIRQYVTDVRAVDFERIGAVLMAHGDAPQGRRNDGAFHRFVKKPVPIVHSTKDNLQVLYEDNHIVAVNKRSGDVVQGSGTGEASLCGWSPSTLPRSTTSQARRTSGPSPVGPACLGVILYARTSKAHKRLSTMFRHREMQKTYWAVVKPAPPKTEGHVINFWPKTTSSTRASRTTSRLTTARNVS